MLGLLPSGHLLRSLLEIAEDYCVENEGRSSFAGEGFGKVVHALAKRGVASYPEERHNLFAPRDGARGFLWLVAKLVTDSLRPFVHSVDDELPKVFGGHLHDDWRVIVLL